MTGRVRLLKSLTFRLALLYLAVFVGSVAILVGAVYWMGVVVPLRQIQDQVRTEAASLSITHAYEGAQGLLHRLEVRQRAPGPRAAYHLLARPDGSIVSTNLPDVPAALASRDWVRLEFGTYEGGDEKEHEALLHAVALSDGGRLLVGRDTEDIDEREDFVREVLIWGALLTVIFGCVGGLLVSQAVARRLEAINRAAREVIAGDLSGRVVVQGGGDDFDQLALTLNEMLARIEELVQSVSRVSDSIAHELRTPLTRMHGDLEGLVLQTRGDPSAAPLARQALLEAERLGDIFDALLRIARIETGKHEASLAPTDLRPLVLDAVEFYQPEAQSRGQIIETEVEGALVAPADRDLVFQALTNLLDNATKFSPRGTRIRVRASRAEGHVQIAVRDGGPGVAPQYRARITERFFRAPDTRSETGLGLGLSLVAAVVRLHGGSLVFADASPGLEVRLDLPAG